MQFNILIIDDEKLVCNSLRRILCDREKKVIATDDLKEAWRILKENAIDLVLLDYKLGEVDGITVLEEIRVNYPQIIVVMITAYGSIDTAVKALKLGAYDFIQKLDDTTMLQYTIQRALDSIRLRKEVEELRAKYEESSRLPEIVAVSPKMGRIMKLAREFAKSDATILLAGETGSGKTLLAQYIHLHSPRFRKPFISINCSAIPKELIESELFGYEKGAFTGAKREGKPGLIEKANQGTLFFDEIGNLSLDLQAKILHVLDHHQFYKVGATQPSLVDVRFIAATNANLLERVEQNQFRLDLYYRLNVAQIVIPPLRERKADILPLTKWFIEACNRKLNKTVTRIEPEAVAYLESLTWQGNVRELENTIERAMLLKYDDTLTLEDFVDTAQDRGLDQVTLFNLNLLPTDGTNLLHEAQRQVITQALKLTNNNRSKAARLVGIPRTTLNYYIKRFELA
jgi:DNA-binding NtrC family response regulator